MSELDELEKILSEDSGEGSNSENKEPAQPSDATPSGEPSGQPDSEVLKKQEHLANLDKAISEAQSQLKTLRQAKKQPVQDNELPKIDFEDPSSQAWNNHIRSQVNPVREELEQEKEEIRRFALNEFLSEKPALAGSPEKVKLLVQMYEKIRTATERTKEGVLLDLEKAYGAVFHKELIEAVRTRKIDEIKKDSILSDVAISRGATSYQEQRPTQKVLSQEEKEISNKWDESLKRLGIG